MKDSSSEPTLEAKQPPTNETLTEKKERKTDEPNPQVKERLYRERRLGIWTLYYPVAGSWIDSIPAVDLLKRVHNFVSSIPVAWKFLLETVALGPVLFVMLFIAEMISSIVPSIHLHNNAKTLNIAEQALAGHDQRATVRNDFSYLLASYIAAVLVGWAARVVRQYAQSILKQRIMFHFAKRILKVRSHLDLASSENPAIQSKINKVTSYHSRAWSIVKGLVEILAIGVEFTGQTSTLAHLVKSREDARIFGLVCIVRPLLTQMLYMHHYAPFYALVTNSHWLRMKALYKLGTDSKFSKEVLGGGLNDFIGSQHEKEMKAVGDTSEEHPDTQLYQQRPVEYSDIDALFDALPLLMFAWGAIQNRSDALSLTSLVMIQQSASAFQSIIWRIAFSGGRMWNSFDNVVALYEVLDLKPSMKDGEVLYTSDDYIVDKGAAIELRGVNFTYPMTDKQVLKDVSFSIDSGQLCVIVGENGCGKSTTINLITRLYDSTSGTVLIDGHLISEYKISSLRAAINVMYQDYHHLPLTIRDNILLGFPDSQHPDKAIEEASKLGGSYDFIRKLPLGFDTNIEPQNQGYSNRWSRETTAEKYKKFVDAQKPIKLSGGEWQRLALTRTFMKNSEHIRLLCYDEPSASLDPKAEYEIFERLRDLRGKKTMIFVTHRFGHLTKHADLILYMKDGSIVEKGTHKQLLAQDGEYAKMYAVQSQAFSDTEARV